MNQRRLEDDPTHRQDNIVDPARNRRHRRPSGSAGSSTAARSCAGRPRWGWAAPRWRRSSDVRPPVRRRPRCCGRCRMTRRPVCGAARCGWRPSASRRTSTSTSRPPRSSPIIGYCAYEGLFTYDEQYQADPRAGGDAHRQRRRSDPHHGAAPGRHVPQRRGDEGGRRDRLGRALGPHQRRRQAADGEDQRAGPGRRLHARVPPQRAVRHDPDRAGPQHPGLHDPPQVDPRRRPATNR